MLSSAKTPSEYKFGGDFTRNINGAAGPGAAEFAAAAVEAYCSRG